jgi:predicted lipid-binding transport protein (Tim44 family)
MRKILGGLLTGLGIGAVIGLNADGGLLGWAVAVAAVGVALMIFRSRGSADLVADATTASRPVPPAEEAGKPTVAGLGTRVDQIIRMAEQQAADHKRTAEAEAGRIIGEARAEADRLRRRD